MVIKSLPATSLKRKRDQHMLTGAGGGVYWWPERVTEGGETEGETKSNIEMTSEPMAKANTEADGQLRGGGEFRKRRKSLTPWVYHGLKDNLQTIHPKCARSMPKTLAPLSASHLTRQSQVGAKEVRRAYMSEKQGWEGADCQVSSLTMETAVRAAAVFFFCAIYPPSSSSCQLAMALQCICTIQLVFAGGGKSKWKGWERKPDKGTKCGFIKAGMCLKRRRRG